MTFCPMESPSEWTLWTRSSEAIGPYSDEMTLAMVEGRHGGWTDGRRCRRLEVRGSTYPSTPRHTLIPSTYTRTYPHVRYMDGGLPIAGMPLTGLRGNPPLDVHNPFYSYFNISVTVK